MLREILINNVDAQFIVYVGIVVGVLLAFEGIRQILVGSGSKEEARSRRMQMIQKGATTEEILAILKPDDKKTFTSRLPLVGDLPKVLRQAGITMSSGAFLTTCFAGFVAVAVLFSQLTSIINAVVFGFLLCMIVPILAVRLQRTQRVNDLVKQLPDALEMMARGLKVGDRLSVSRGRVTQDIVVLGLSDRRGPASVATTMYEETPDSIERRQAAAEAARLARGAGPAAPAKRPDKRSRRAIHRMRRESGE